MMPFPSICPGWTRTAGPANPRQSRRSPLYPFVRIGLQFLTLHLMSQFRPALAFFDSKKSAIHIIQDPETRTETRYKVAEVNYHHVEKPFMLSVWILLASFAKIGFHLSPKPSSYVPESCMLILLGVFSGIIIFFSRIGNIDYTLSTGVFFLFLLPPIVLEAGYFMPRRPFFENIGTILLLAVVGTLWNTLTMGLALWGISNSGLVGFQVPLLHCLLFSSLISAVDPVAILAVFEEAQVNEVLHIVVFGESLLNDGVAVVLYNMFGVYSKIGYQNIITQDIVNGVLSFFVVALGGTLIGILFGMFTGWLTKYTNKVTIIEPLFIFLLAYVSYLVADMFKLSGILAIVFCGLIMRKYVEANIALKSQTTVKYTMKMLSSMCESIIFLFLGLSTVVDYHVWNTAFTLFSIFFCLLFRAMGVLIMIPFLNRRRLIKMGSVDIFILIYGGLRGAISFSLALLLDEESIGEINKKMFVTTTVTIVIFTSFFQGLTIRPLVEILRVKKATAKDKNMGEILFERCFDHLLVGIEDLVGARGRNRVRDQFEVFEAKYLKPYLMKRVPASRENKLIEVCTKLNLKDANEYIQQCGGDIHAMKKDLSMMDDSQAIGNMPVIDTTHLDPVYSNREDTDRWHGMMEDIMYQPRQKIKKYSRHMLFDNPSHVSIQTTPAHRHTSRLKTSRPLLEPQSYKKRKTSDRTLLSKSGSIRSKNSNSSISRYSRIGGGIGATLRRLSLSITGSPTREAPPMIPSGTAERKRTDEGIYFSATQLKRIPEVPSQPLLEQPRSNGPASNGSKPNYPAESPETSSDSSKHVNFVVPPREAEIAAAATSGAAPSPKATPNLGKRDDISKKGSSSAAGKLPTQKPSKESDANISDREDVRLLKDMDEDSSNDSTRNTSTPPSILVNSHPLKTPSTTAQPVTPTPKSSASALPLPIPTATKDKKLPDKLLLDISDEKSTPGEQKEKPEGGEDEEVKTPKDELTIAEKALPWKTPSPNPLKMPNPPRKLSDAYFNAPANLTSILEHSPVPPPSNKDLHDAKLEKAQQIAAAASVSSTPSGSPSFRSAYPSAVSSPNPPTQMGTALPNSVPLIFESKIDDDGNNEEEDDGTNRDPNKKS